MVGQQGRVSLEADVNEGQRIFSEEARHHALDFVGPCGTPDDGYKVTAPTPDFLIGPGTMYTGGVRTTLEQPVHYSAQKDWLDIAQPQPWADDLWRPPGQLSQGNSHAMLLLEEREITAVEDPALREVALGGPDSMARTRILQRVIAPPNDGATCASGAAAMANFWSDHGLIYDAKTASLTPRARLKVEMVQAAPPPSPCDPPATSGYLGADNQLIRVQLAAYDANTRRGKLLWAYHNGSNLYRVKALDSTTLELTSRPVSAEFEPRSGQVAQVLFAAAEIAAPITTPNVFPDGAYAAALTGHRALLNSPYAAESKRVTLPGPLPAVFPLAGTPPAVPPLFLCIWDEELDFELNNPVTLNGTGLLVTISGVNAGNLHVGDSWSFAVRPLTPNAVYPERYLESPQIPEIARRWVCSLAVLHPQGAPAAPDKDLIVDDCRVPFDPLTTPHGEGKDKDCCCIKVSPEDADQLQDIVDKAAQGANGAAVSIHLEAGLYRLRRPLVLDRRHRGVVIEACTGVKPVLTGGEDPRFAHGLIITIGAAEITIRGLEFRMIPIKLPDALRKLMEAAAAAAGISFSPPRQISIAIRVVQTLSISIEDCDFRMPGQEATFSVGVLVQAISGAVTVSGCRFDGASAISAGIVLGSSPAADSRDEQQRLASIELLRIEHCVFARLSVAIALAGTIGICNVEGNVTQYVYTSLLTLWFNQKLVRLRDVFAAMKPNASSALVKQFLSDLKQDPVLSNLLPLLMLIPLEELEKEAGDKREFVYTLVDLPADAAQQAQMGPPETLRLTVLGNQFDARRTNDAGGPDTIIWDLLSTSAEVNLSHNTHWNRSELPTVTVLQCDGFNVTGNVIGNQTNPGTDRKIPALVVQPEVPNPAPKPAVFPFTVTGNTIFGSTNLNDFPRAEWSGQLPPGVGLATWEFFNAIL
jgi:hypothetical protein